MKIVMKIDESYLLATFPRCDFDQQVAAGEYGFNLVDKLAFKEWLKESQLSMLGEYGPIKTDLRKTRYIEVGRATSR